METLIVVALLGVALLHASWHAMIKSSGDRLVGLAGMNVVSSACALVALPAVALPKPELWPVLVFSVVLHNAYKGGLAQVYRHGDLGQAYPIARGITPLFATAIAFAALHESPSALQLTGIALISAGLVTLSLERGSNAPGMKLLGFAALTGLMAAAYTVVDAYGVRLNGDWISYTLWLMALDGLSFVIITNVLRGRLLWRELAGEWRRTLLSGSLGVTAFAVFLWALSRGPVGGVSALRETSVLFATLIGWLFLKERWSWVRSIGALLIGAGIIVFAFKN